MFKIGDFSRLTRVSIKTLRHYDEIGLFIPIYVEPVTGYRYYSFDQLPRLNRILALRGLGFTLEQIREMLTDDTSLVLSAGQLRAMLTLRRAQLQQEIDARQIQLANVESRLQQIEQEGNMSEVEVLVKSVPAITLVGAREIVPRPTLMRERCIALNDQVCAVIAAAHLKTDGISLALYYSSDEHGIDVEMAYGVEEHSQGEGVHKFPEATVAYVVYRGSYDDFGAVGQLHGAIVEWVTANGYRVSDACREYYLRPPRGANDHSAIMEIQYPIERVML
jgi:DNA-binding transcriptional MerR regulator